MPGRERRRRSFDGGNTPAPAGPNALRYPRVLSLEPGLGPGAAADSRRGASGAAAGASGAGARSLPERARGGRIRTRAESFRRRARQSHSQSRNCTRRAGRRVGREAGTARAAATAARARGRRRRRSPPCFRFGTARGLAASSDPLRRPGSRPCPLRACTARGRACGRCSAARRGPRGARRPRTGTGTGTRARARLPRQERTRAPRRRRGSSPPGARGKPRDQTWIRAALSARVSTRREDATQTRGSRRLFGKGTVGDPDPHGSAGHLRTRRRGGGRKWSPRRRSSSPGRRRSTKTDAFLFFYAHRATLFSDCASSRVAQPTNQPLVRPSSVRVTSSCLPPRLRSRAYPATRGSTAPAAAWRASRRSARSDASTSRSP